MDLQIALARGINALEYIVAAGIGIDAVNNLANSNYQMAILEGIGTIYIGVEAWHCTNQLNRYHKYCNMQDELISSE